MERRVALTPADVQRLLGTLRAALDEVYGNNLVAIRLFGSYARRQATPDSDVDVLLVLRENEDYGTEVRRISDLLSRLSLECGKTIAPVFVDAARFASGSGRNRRAIPGALRVRPAEAERGLMAELDRPWTVRCPASMGDARE